MWQEPFATISKLWLSALFKMKLSFNIWEYFFLYSFSKYSQEFFLNCTFASHTCIPFLSFRFICNFILFWLVKCFITMTHKICGRYKKHMSHHIFLLSYRISPLSKYSPAMRVFSQTFPSTWVLLSSFPVMQVIKRHRCHNWLFRLHIQSLNSEINLNTLLYTCLIQRWSN